MTGQLILATSKGVVICERSGDAGGWRLLHRGLDGAHITSVTTVNGTILAGSRQGVWRSGNMGRTWGQANQGLNIPYVRWMSHNTEEPNVAFAGTEPAGIFVSVDGAETWQARPEVEALRDRHKWFLPYSPEAGCVRGFAFNGRRAYAAVEVGGVLRSDDGGQHWALAPGSDGNPNLSGPPEPFVYPDVHAIYVHPGSPQLVFAPTGGGFYRSADGGATWDLLYDCYCRAMWADPNQPQHLLLGPADGVDSDARIEVSPDGGQTWAPASGGLEVPWPNHMVERFVPAGDEMLAILSNGEVLLSRVGDWQWQTVLPEAGKVHAAIYDDGVGGLSTAG
jgi:photosystem II stability/assembly factor-like uncharacterized protein